MPGLGRKTWNPGDTLTAADVNGYLMDQTVMLFAGTAARASAIPTPSAGMVAYSTATDMTVYDGSAWERVAAMKLVKRDSITAGSANKVVSNAFNSSFNNYRIILENFTVAAGTPDLRFQLRIGGTTAATNYSYGGTNSNYTNRTDVNASATTFWLAGYLNTTANNHVSIDVYRPFVAAATTYYSNNASITASLQVGGFHSTTTSYDSFELTLSTATTISTGTIYVYGFAT